MNHIASLLSVLLLAGCLQPPVETTEPDEVGAVEGLLHLDQCSGALAFQEHLLGTNPSEPPAGWQEDVRPSRVMMWLWSCKAVGFAGLERPATLLWEVSDNAFPPGACRTESSGSFPWYVVNALTDDEVLAQRMRELFDVPVDVVEFEREERQAGEVWSWGPDAHGSRVEWFHGGLDANSTHGPVRWLWPVGDGVAVMDVLITFQDGSAVDRLAVGELDERHRLGVDGRFAGKGHLTRAGSMLVEFERRGVDCV